VTTILPPQPRNPVPRTQSLRRDEAMDECERCHYCELLFSYMRHEHDHAPIPVRAGGMATVPICLNCHEMKDRQPFDQWPPDYAFSAVRDLMTHGPIPRGTEIDWPTQWGAMSTWTRLLWAKMCATAHDFRVTGHLDEWQVPALWDEHYG
jgi:hypothetical protein